MYYKFKRIFNSSFKYSMKILVIMKNHTYKSNFFWVSEGAKWLQEPCCYAGGLDCSKSSPALKWNPMNRYYGTPSSSYDSAQHPIIVCAYILNINELQQNPRSEAKDFLKRPAQKVCFSCVQDFVILEASWIFVELFLKYDWYSICVRVYVCVCVCIIPISYIFYIFVKFMARRKYFLWAGEGLSKSSSTNIFSI